MKTIETALLCAIFFVHIASADSKPLNLELSRAGAVQFALQNNLELKAVKMGIDAAKGRARQSGQLPNPDIGGEYSNDMAFQNRGEYELKTQISQKFPLFGRLSKEKNAAEIDIKLAENEYRQARLALALQVETAYIDALQKNAAISAKRELAAALEKLGADTEDSLKKAEASNIEYMQIRGESEKIGIEIMEDEIAAESAIVNLKNLLGLQPSAKITLSDKLQPITPSDKNFSREVLENRPDWQMYSLVCESAAAQIALIKAGKFDDIEIGILYSSKFEEGERNDKLGIALTIPLPFASFDGDISSKLAMRRRAETLADAKETRISNEISLHKMRARKYAEILRKYDSSISARSEKIYGEYLDARAKGQATLTEIFSAWETNLRLKMAKSAAVSEQAKSAIELNYSLGIFENYEK